MVIIVTSTIYMRVDEKLDTYTLAFGCRSTQVCRFAASLGLRSRFHSLCRMKPFSKTFLAFLCFVVGTVSALLLVFLGGVAAVAIHNYGISEYEASQTDYGFGMGMVVIGFLLLIALVPMLSLFFWKVFRRMSTK